MSENLSSKKNRTRYYASVVYPESAPDSWRDILSDSIVPAFVSPLHDMDVNPDGEIKKPHFHVLIMFESLKTPEQAKEIFDKIGGVGCEKVVSLRGYARYLCHLDNSEKYQYNTEDVTTYGGADYIATIGLATDKYKAIGEMIDYCAENNIYSYSRLLEWCRINRFDWFRVLCDNGTFVIKEYLKSKTWETKGGQS